MSAASPVEDIFFAALQKPTTEERAAFLDAACGGDASLRARVERLLAAHPHAAGFLEEPAAGNPTRDLPPTGPLPAAEEPGQWAGPYKLLQKLGEGGMGTVWVAEQEQPVRRRVALKLIKAGMDSERVLARFEAERQALALMDHTNIAKVFDAGTTPAGRPYFAMELVKGVPITRYCDELHLSIRDRLGLFVDVCRAVQHAHQKGVIHRDIKPTNVLVAIQDGKPVPKVIDFGVAKAVHAKLADRTLFTELGAVIGTPEYMAPEQAELSALDVDTRADVYALGALLYELLTGSTPLGRDRLRAAGLAEVLRLIREEDPPKPSTRLSQSKEEIAGLAAKRRTEPRRLGAEVQGELDWIAMRALEKDRTRRYETASGLARDVERYLADEPVEACPPGAGYRLRKFFRRNRAAVTATAAILIAVVLAAVGQTWNLLRARDAEQRAVYERNNAEAARQDAERERDRAREEEGKALDATILATESAVAAAKARLEAVKAARDALGSKKQTEAALTRSDGLRLGSQAMLARPADPGLALLLGLEAVRHYPHPLTFNALFDAAGDLREKRTITTDLPNLYHFRASLDGARFLVGAGERTGSDRGTAVVYDAATGKLLTAWHGFHHGLADLDWSPDGTRAVAATSERVMVAFTDGKQPEQATYTDRVAYVWDTATGRDVAHLRRHDDKVVSARFSPDGKKIVTASWDETARIWDATTGKELHVLRGHTRALATALYSPDGKRVLTVSSQAKKTAHYRDDAGKPLPDRAPNTDPGIPTRPWRAGGSSSGYRGGYAADPERAFARLWDPDTGEQVGELVVEKGIQGLTDFGTDRPSAASYSLDGRRIAVGFLNDMIGVWDAAGGKQLHLFRRHDVGVNTLAFSPDGKRLAAAGAKNFILLYDLETGRELRRLEGHDHTAVHSVQFSKDGARLVSAAGDKTARVWDVATGKELAALRGHTEAVRAAVFHGDAETVVTAGDQTVRVWSVPPPAPVPTLLTGGTPPGALARLFGGSQPRGHTSHVTALAFSPDGRTVVTGDQDRNVRLWDAATGKLAGGVTDGIRGEVRHVSFTADGKAVYIGTNLNVVAPGERGDRETLLSMVHRWDPATGTATRFLKGQAAGVFHMALSPDGRRALIVNTSSGLAFQPTKTNPLSYMWNDAEIGVTVWDTETGKLLSRLPSDQAVTGLPPPLFFPDGKAVLLVPGRGDELAVYDAATGSRVRTLTAPKDNQSANWSGMAVSPDGRVIAAQKQGGQFVWFWDAATGAVLGSHRITEATPSWVPILRFSPDSKRLAVTADRFVLVLDAATRGRAQFLRGHEAEVKAVAFSPDGSRLLTGSDDRSAILWDVATGRIQSVYKGHPGPVQLVAYSPDGQRVATASTDPLARVWPVDLLPEFEKRKPRELTAQERGRYELPAR